MVWPNQAGSDGSGKKWPDWNNPQSCQVVVRCLRKRGVKDGFLGV